MVVLLVLAALPSSLNAVSLETIEGDRFQLLWQLGPAVDAITFQMLTGEMVAVSLTGRPYALYREMTYDPRQAELGGFIGLAGAGVRIYPFLTDGRRFLGGMSAGLRADFGFLRAYEDTGGGPEPEWRYIALGLDVGVTAGLSAKLFGWLFVEAITGPSLMVRHVTELVGDWNGLQIGDTSLGIGRTRSIRLGVSF